MRPPVLAALLLAQTTAHSQSADLLLKRIVEHMSHTLAVQPNYTCVETVERWITPRKGKRYMQDRLRFEVALVDGKETFAWPGAQKIRSDRPVHHAAAWVNGYRRFRHRIARTVRWKKRDIF